MKFILINLLPLVFDFTVFRRLGFFNIKTFLSGVFFDKDNIMCVTTFYFMNKSGLQIRATVLQLGKFE